MKIKDLPKVPRPDRRGDWDLYDCVIFAEAMHDLWPEIKEAIRISNRKARDGL